MITSSDRGDRSGRRSGGAPRRFETASAAETERVGASLGRLLRGGELVLLSGELGTGKTTFIRGLARGLRVDDAGSVHSPSYTLVNRYTGRIGLTHVDAYFMRSAEDIELSGMLPALEAGDVAAVEWADLIPSPLLPAGAIRVALTHGGGTARSIVVEDWPEPV